MPRLRILAGPSPSTAVPITANDGSTHEITGAHFEGRVCVFIRYEDQVQVRSRAGSRNSSRPASRAGSNDSSESVAPVDAALRYFGSPERRNVTWSVQIQGRFTDPVSADDVLFGNTFERPLKLPWGSSAALKFMNFIDPTLEHDLGGAKPWALSPLVSTMPYLAHTELPANANASSWPEFPPSPPLTDDCGSLIPDNHTTNSKSHSPSPPSASNRLFPTRSRPSSREPSPARPSTPVIAPASSKRRSIFATQAARRATTLGPADLLTADFCYGFLSFPSLTLKLPGGISFDCMRYWDRQPVTFMCCRRAKDGKGPGDPFWCVVFEVIEDEEQEQEQEATTEPERIPVTISPPENEHYGAGQIDEVD
ncbi:DUF1769-domain-containing protein [Auriculariales sp. MPI-PUGE-AT-0066]|nr:DUF1769-domain-containing protein [Auriculariales sp. MPI-PUGE-AT-0066]